jgi:hypothetical protein
MAKANRPVVYKQNVVKDVLPGLEYVKGFSNHWIVTEELKDGKHFVAGFGFHAADADTLSWKWETDAEEVLYCIKGQVKVIGTLLSGEGEEIELIADAGDAMYLASGYAYSMPGTGKETVSFIVRAPSSPMPEEFANKHRALRGEY